MKRIIAPLFILIFAFNARSQEITTSYFDKYKNLLPDSIGAEMKCEILDISDKNFTVNSFSKKDNLWIKESDRYIVTRKKNNKYDVLKYIGDIPQMQTQIEIVDTLINGFLLKEYNNGFCFRQAEAKSIFPLIIHGKCTFFGKTKKDQTVTKYYFNNLAYEPIVSDLLNVDQIASLLNNPKDVSLPQYPGGIRQFRLDILDNIEIPVDQFNLLDSIWSVMFTIDEKGNLNNPSLITGINPEVNTYLINTLELLTNPWIAANNGNTDVSFTYVLPIEFTVKELADAKFKKEHPGKAGFQYAMFKGGQVGLRKAIASHLNYPDYALKNGIEGRVIVTFVVDTTGSIKNPIIVRSSHESLEDEAIRVVQMLNGWIPAKQYGIPVSSCYTVPIRFAMRKDISTFKQ